MRKTVIVTAVLLLATASVEAGEQFIDLTFPLVEEPKIKHGPSYADVLAANAGWPTVENDTIATCDEHLKNCQVLVPERFPCYQRMQEAMKAMDEFTKGTGVVIWSDRVDGIKTGPQFKPHQATQQLWDATMKECVK